MTKLYLVREDDAKYFNPHPYVRDDYNMGGEEKTWVIFQSTSLREG